MRSVFLKGVAALFALGFAGAAAEADVTIGVAGPITGANASFGAQLTQGVAQAAEDFNKSGGILGQKIDVDPGFRSVFSHHHAPSPQRTWPRRPPSLVTMAVCERGPSRRGDG